MKRTSTDAEYLDSGKLVIDADGIEISLPLTQDAKPGQVLKWDGTGFKWAWLGQYPSNYHDTY